MSRARGGGKECGLTVVLSVLLVGLGLAVLVRTVAAGVGGGLGLLLGTLMVLAGVLRLYLGRR
ncbi:MAG TPA: hypothetical protein VGJ25_06280 [Gaiellaceae bacterium]